jgi:MFS family permease
VRHWKEVSAYASLQSRNFRFLLASSILSVFAQQMLSIVVGWDLYQATHSAIVLGNVGLVQIIPPILFTVAAGYVADHYDRRRVAIAAQAIIAVVGFILAGAGAARGVALIYSCLLLSATARAFQWPVSSAMLPQVVEPDQLTSAISWQGTGRELSTVTGPALAGLLIAWKGSEAVYLAQALCAVASVACYSMMRLGAVLGGPRPESARPALNWHQMGEGIRFVFREKVILAALSLDLLAVFFGGAVTLLPIFAQDILRVGPTGLGWLRAAPAFGAALMAIFLAHHGRVHRAGSALLWSVAGFGAATICFALATAGWISFAMLFFTGVFDSVSVVLRLSLVQMRTPDHLRGRVSAVNGLFIACSNQWGAVESGWAAAWLGTVPSVVWGGIATIAVVTAIAVLSPSLRQWRNEPVQEAEVAA